MVANGHVLMKQKNSALEIINDMSANDVMSIIRVGSIAESLTDYTSDKNQLRRGN